MRGMQVAGFILIALGLLIWWQMVYLGNSLGTVWSNIASRFNLPGNLVSGTPKSP